MLYTSESVNPFRLTFEPRNPFLDRTLRLTSRLIERTTQLNRLSRLYQDEVKDSENDAIPEKVLQALHVTCEISEADIQRIPITGPVVVVANHPFGAIENLVLLSAVSRVRRDAKVMANHLVACIPEMHSLCIFVDPYGQRDSKKRKKSIYDYGYSLVFSKSRIRC